MLLIQGILVNPSIFQPKGWNLPFDKPFDELKVVSVSNGSRVRVQPRGSGLTLSGNLFHALKDGA
jgi:hypothetical protein